MMIEEDKIDYEIAAEFEKQDYCNEMFKLIRKSCKLPINNKLKLNTTKSL